MCLTDQAALTGSFDLLGGRVAMPGYSRPHATKTHFSKYLYQLILIAGQQQIAAVQPFALSDGAPHTITVVWAHCAVVIDLAAAHKENARIRICACVCTAMQVRNFVWQAPACYAGLPQVACK